MNQIHPSAVVSEDVQLGEDVVIGPNCVIGDGVTIGSGTVLDASVVVGRDVKMGKGNHLFPNCSVGGPPQVLGFGPDSEYGKLIIGDKNVIREQVTIHPSMHAGQLTKVGSENLLMIGVHIGHDCIVEDNAVISNYTQVSGHCHIGQGVWLSGMVLIQQFTILGKWCYAAGLTGINHDIPPFLIVSGHYPPQVRGVNKRGMSRAGLNEQQQQNIWDAYKKLYRNGSPLLNNAMELVSEPDLDENVRAIVDTIINSSKHRFGRYLETFRD